MANEYAVNSQDLKAVADAIRTKGETTESLVFPDGFAQAIADIKAGEDVEQATPEITVSSGGLITASATQAAGLVPAGTKTATKQLTVQAAQTITPGTSNKTIASGRYLTGTQTIKGDANLKAANIKKGVSIFGVAGSYTVTSGDITLWNGSSFAEGYDGLGVRYNSESGTAGTFTVNSGGYLYLYAPNKTGSHTIGYFARSIDLTDYSQLTVKLAVRGWSGGVIGVCSNPSNISFLGASPGFGGMAAYTQPTSTNNVTYNGTVSVDVSSLSGKYYIMFGTAGSGGSNYSGEMKIYTVTLID